MTVSHEHQEPEHDYHLVDPSIWPFVGSIAGFLLAFGLVFYMHPNLFGEAIANQTQFLGVWKIMPGVMLMAITLFAWWGDVVKESLSGFHKPIVQLGLRYGMVLFIASEVMFFVAFFWAFFEASLFYDDAIQFARVEANGGQWPPKGILTFNPFELPFINTLILLLSGCTVTWAHHALLANNREALKKGLLYTVILGVIFTLFQAYEYSHAAFGIKDGIYASTFYLATGFHGFHVIVGTIFLFVCYVRSLKGHFSPEQHFGFEAAAWYWHFVDVVWLFLFICVYWWGG